MPELEHFAQQESTPPKDGVPRLEVYPTANNEWSWRLRAANSQTIALPGESFTRKSDALRSMVTVMELMGRTVDEDGFIHYHEVKQ